MAEPSRFTLIQDRKGLIWDLLLYVPTVVFLFLIGLKLWYSPDQVWSYVLFFMASFFFITVANRILATRLMLLPSAIVALEVARQQVTLTLRNGQRVDLVKNVRFYTDYAGKSFGLSGMDLLGKRRQFVLHRGQFSQQNQYNDLRALLNVYR